MSVDLYGAKTGNCLRAAIALEEAGISYDVRHVDLMAGEHKSAPFLGLNPSGVVPVLVDRRDERSPLILTQSNAIVIYAADAARGCLLPPVGTAERAKVFERFFYFLTDVIAPSHAGFYLSRQRHPAAADLLQARALDAASAAERFAAGSDFIAGSEFSIADVAAFTMLSSVKSSLAWGRLPNLEAWFARVEVRPSIMKGMRAFDLPVS